MLRATREVRALRPHERQRALELCAVDPVANVYVAARLAETDLRRPRGALQAYAPYGRPDALCWHSANLVPVGCDDVAAEAFARRLRRHSGQFSSVFGPRDQVEALWSRLRPWWPEPLDQRWDQPLLVLDPDTPLGAPVDPRVRPAELEETDLILPAAAAMFTEEIGYAPYSDRGSRQAYRQTIRGIISRRHCLVLREGDAIVFKAEIGSVGLGACQVQGVWVAPAYRGQGLSGPAMAAVAAYARQSVAPLVSLYVNEYNAPALALYHRVGFRRVGTFSTVLL